MIPLFYSICLSVKDEEIPIINHGFNLKSIKIKIQIVIIAKFINA